MICNSLYRNSETLEAGKEINDAGEGLLEVCIVCSIGSPPFPHLNVFWCRLFILHGADQCNLCVRSFPELKISLLMMPYRNTTVSALFYPGRKVWIKFIFPLTPSPPHQLSSHRKTSSGALYCTCIAKLCSAVMTLYPEHYQSKRTTTPHWSAKSNGYTNGYNRNPI